jgi:hypothetical protein
MSGLRLYQITQALDTCIDPETGYINVERLHALSLQFESKAIACAAVTKNLRAESDAVDAEIARLQKRKASIDNHRRQLLDYLLLEMQKAGIDQIGNGIHQIRRAKSPLSVTIQDEEKIPTQFRQVVIERKIDKKGIIDWIKETGEVVDGCDIVQNEHLRIS